MGMGNTVHTSEPLVDLKTEVIGGDVYMMAASNWKHNIVVSNICLSIKLQLKHTPCKVFSENFGLKLHSKKTAAVASLSKKIKKGDYVEPDVMIACKNKLIRGSYYEGVPKFVAEVVSPSTIKHDTLTKFLIYESLGVSEYWVVRPVGTLQIYYLKKSKYELHDDIMLVTDKYDEDYNADLNITLRDFPEARVRLGDIFDFGEE